MNNELTRDDLVDLLVKHLPPLAEAMMNLSRIISTPQNMSLHEIKKGEHEELLSNIKVAIKSLKELLDKLSESSSKSNDPEIIAFLKELHKGAIEINLTGIEDLLIWLNGKDEVDFKNIVHVLFLGSQSISQIVNKLTE